MSLLYLYATRVLSNDSALWTVVPFQRLEGLLDVLQDRTGLICPRGTVGAVPYPHAISRTALASFPRSGSSYTRSLIERATGFQTSAIYCDDRLAVRFKSECLGLDVPFIVKTHYPSNNDIDPAIKHWTHFTRAIRVIRNPFDCIWSFTHFERTQDHSARVTGVEDLSLKRERNRRYLERRIFDRKEHARYWTEEAEIPVMVVRYEDLRRNGRETLQKLVNFWVPDQHRPSSRQIFCALVDDSSKDPYFSRKSAPFSSWHRYDNETRTWLLENVKEVWCQHDYNQLFEEAMRLPAPVNCTGIASIVSK